MKLNHFFVAALALGLTHSFVLAGALEAKTKSAAVPAAAKIGGSSGGGEKKEDYSTTRATAGTTRVSTRGTVTNSISRVTTARPATIRTAGLTRVNLRRPTTTTTTPP